MGRSVIIRRLSVAATIVVLVAVGAGSPNEAGAGPGPTQSEDVCGGVRLGDSGDAAPRVGSAGYYIADLGPFVLRVDSVYSDQDFAYLLDLFDILLPAMTAVLGPPAPTLDTLTVELNNDDLQYYRSWTNTISMDPIVHLAEPFDRSFDSLFIHELTHAWMDDVLWTSWISEGMADASRHFVADLATATSGRNVRAVNYARRMAVYDLSDNVGEQVLAGGSTIAYRVDLGLLYQNAAGAFILPAYAQLGVDPGDPPLAAFIRELRAELADAPYDPFSAMDRAWSAPVDGVLPPSRWVRGRAVTCPSSRNGEFIALLPAYSLNNMAPLFIRVLHFSRNGPSYETLPYTSAPRYVDVHGNVTDGTDTVGPYSDVPTLVPGAYLVDIHERVPQGVAKTARTWAFVPEYTPRGDGLWDGIAAIFVGEDGVPVDVPHDDLTVNGLITARVPGGVIATPRPGTTALTFSLDGRPLATFTVTGELPRMVVIPVTPPATTSVVEWSPYRPAPSEEVTVEFLLAESALDPLANNVEVTVTDLDGTVLAEQPMLPSSAPGVLVATFTMPDGVDIGALQFTDGTGLHAGCRYFPCYSLYGYTFTTRPAGSPSKAHLSFDGRHLSIRFEGAAAGDEVRLDYAPDETGPWTTVAQAPAVVETRTLRWDTREWIGDGVYVRLSELGDPPAAVLCEQFISPLPAFERVSPMLPFPNPVRSEVSWPFDVEGRPRAVFRVYDVAGRIVHEEPARTLHPGTELFRWPGTARDGRAPSGVYFLRLSGTTGTFTRKVVVIR